VSTKWVIAQYWNGQPELERQVFAPHLEDLSHACCFACGYFSERWERATPRASWERAALERAHIVPAGLGGADQTSNIILLCPPCHRDSPDWHDPWEMAIWISRRAERPSHGIEQASMWLDAAKAVPHFMATLGAFDTRGGTEEQALTVMREAVRKAVVHGGKEGGLSQATMEAVLRHTARELERPERGRGRA
jgi:hypothetical protein